MLITQPVRHYARRVGRATTTKHRASSLLALVLFASAASVLGNGWRLEASAATRPTTTTTTPRRTARTAPVPRAGAASTATPTPTPTSTAADVSVVAPPPVSTPRPGALISSGVRLQVLMPVLAPPPVPTPRPGALISSGVRQQVLMPAFTGSSSGPLALLGVALVVAGTGAVLVARRRVA